MEEATILKHAMVNSTGERKPMKEKMASHSIVKTGEIEPAGLATKEEYVIELKIRQTFWCNKAQYSRAVVIAEKALLAELFSPVLSISARLRKAAMDDDFEEVFSLASELDKQCGI